MKILLTHRHSPEEHVLITTDKTLEWVLCEVLTIQNANVEIAPHYELSLSDLCAILVIIHEKNIVQHRSLIPEDWNDAYRTLSTKVLSKANKVKSGTWLIDTYWLWDWRDCLGTIAYETYEKAKCEVHTMLAHDANAQQWL